MSILTQEFVFAALDAEKAGEQFPIDFDLIWQQLGYTRKDSAVDALKNSGYELSKDIRFIPGINKNAGNKYYLTVDCFKGFCMMPSTPEGKEVRRYFIEIEKAYRANLERQFKSTIDPEIEKLRAELDFVKTELATFKSQLSDDFDFDLDTTHHLSGIAASRRYVIGIVLENFRVGVDFIVDDIARPNKAGLPQHKYYLKESVHNSLLIALRSVKGVPMCDSLLRESR